ncbi:MAG TPA: CarD family transcriptional regulator [Clostridia bacterium]|jgi:CarD family transcriptional regulator|nr:CarD family transcriptional regulator [Clostridia bacterium]
MFSIGDKVVYPMHGAGIIEAIEEKEIMGKKQSYYILRMALGQMQVMVPLDSVNNIGLRQIIDKEGVEKVISILREKGKELTSSWNRRYRMHLEKMKTGDIYEVAEVVRNLSLREKEKGLSSGERKMLENARQILISELVLVVNRDEEEIEYLVNQEFNN